MTLKIWRGDAPSIAQKTRITPSGVEIGDVYTLIMNGKSLSVTATAATAANVCTLLAAAIATTNITEFREFVVTNAGGSLLLTAATAGVPFVITGSASNGSVLGVLVTTTTEGSGTGSAVNMTQTFRIPLTAAGDFEVIIGGTTTGAITVGASAATIETAVEGLSTVGAGNCSVAKTTDTNDSIYVLTFDGALAATNVALAVVNLSSTKPLVRTTQAGSSSGTTQNEMQTIDIGTIAAGFTFTLTFDAQTTASIATDVSAANLRIALENLSNITAGGLTVTKTGNVFTVEFTGVHGLANQSQITSSVYSSSMVSVHSITVSSTAASGSGTAVNEVQTITLDGAPTGGTFTLTFDGQTTSAIAYNASAATVATALIALSNIGPSDVTVSGSAGGPWTVTFAGTLAATDVSQLTGNGASLTGGASETISVSNEVASAGPNHWDTALNWLPAGVPANGDDVRFEIGSSQCLYGLAQTSVTLASLQVAMTYSGRIGLSRQNSSGYLEYRQTELAIGCTSVLIGHGEGSGPSKIALNTGTIQTSIEVRDAGGSSESGIPTVTWRGTHVDNAILQFGGDMGIAIYSDQSATVDTLVQRGGTLNAKHTTFNTSVLFRDAMFFDCNLNGQPLESY